MWLLCISRGLVITSIVNPPVHFLVSCRYYREDASESVTPLAELGVGGLYNWRISAFFLIVYIIQS